MAVCPMQHFSHNLLKNINAVSASDMSADEANGIRDGNCSRHFMQRPNDRQVASNG
jgi:hypothetical protein